MTSDLPPPAPVTVHEIGLRSMVVAALTVGAAWVLLRLLPVVLVVIAALFLVGTLNPIVEWLEKKRIRRGHGILIVFSTVFAVVVLMGVITVPSLIEQVATLLKQEPAIRSKLADWLSHSRFTFSLSESLRHMRYDAMASSAATTAFAYSRQAVEVVAYSVSAVFLALYMMIDRDRLRAGLFASIPRRYHVRLSRVLLNLEFIVGGYIRGQVLTSAFMAAFTLVLMLIAGVPNALALAVFAGIADVLPYVGVFLSCGPVIVAALAKGPIIAIVVAVAMLAYEEFESRFLVPRIYGRALRLPSSIVLIALLAGGTLMGIVGALLALPVAAAIRMLISELRLSLPGEDVRNSKLQARDARAEREYEERSHGLPAEAAAQIATHIAEKCEADGPDSRHSGAPVPLSP